MDTVKVIFLKIVRLVDVVRFQYYEYNIVCDRTETRTSNYRQNAEEKMDIFELTVPLETNIKMQTLKR